MSWTNTTRCTRCLDVIEPGWVDQPGTDECWIACMASLTGLPLDGFPQPPTGVRDSKTELVYDKAVRAHLGKHGWLLATVGREAPAGYSIASGKSPRREGYWHSVVYLDGSLAHDPHPDRIGLDGAPVYEYEIIVRSASVLTSDPATLRAMAERWRPRDQHMPAIGEMVVSELLDELADAMEEAGEP